MRHPRACATAVKDAAAATAARVKDAAKRTGEALAELDRHRTKDALY